jgi:hypothetical protein
MLSALGAQKITPYDEIVKAMQATHLIYSEPEYLGIQDHLTKLLKTPSLLNERLSRLCLGDQSLRSASITDDGPQSVCLKSLCAKALATSLCTKLLDANVGALI